MVSVHFSYGPKALAGQTGQVAAVSTFRIVANFLLKHHNPSLSLWAAAELPVRQQSCSFPLKLAPIMSIVLHVRYKESVRSLIFVSAASSLVVKAETRNNALFTQCIIRIRRENIN